MPGSRENAHTPGPFDSTFWNTPLVFGAEKKNFELKKSYYKFILKFDINVTNQIYFSDLIFISEIKSPPTAKSILPSPNHGRQGTASRQNLPSRKETEGEKSEEKEEVGEFRLNEEKAGGQSSQQALKAAGLLSAYLLTGQLLV